MKTTITIPDTIKVTALSKWLEPATKENGNHPQIKFVVEIVNGDKRMTTPYSGGILAFVSDQDSACGVLHSLLMDMDAGAESFQDFCDNFGYDNDSIKALNTYHDCQKLGTEFRRVMGRETIAVLREVLADY